MTAAPKYFTLLKLHYRERLVCRTCDVWGEAVVSWEEASKCTRGTLRGRGPGTCARIAEIMSGRAIFQQGLAATCKDLPTKGTT